MKFDDGIFINDDCLKVMKYIPDKSVNMILADLPYGTTACSWDSIISLDDLWIEYLRIITDIGSIILTASQPFTTTLIHSNIKLFKYELIWIKSRATGHVHSKNKPMKKHENVVVFSKGTTVHEGQSKTRMNYNPQGLIKKDNPKIRKNGGSADTVMSNRPSHKDTLQEYTNYPTSILEFSSEGKTIHPTQKPVELFEYLIKTYSNENDLILDNVAGSGTTAIAAIRNKRRFICIEKERNYYNKAIERVKNEYNS